MEVSIVGTSCSTHSVTGTLLSSVHEEQSISSMVGNEAYVPAIPYAGETESSLDGDVTRAAEAHVSRSKLKSHVGNIGKSNGLEIYHDGCSIGK